MKYPVPIARARLTTVSMTSRNPGARPSTRATTYTTTRVATPMTTARPGSVPKSACLTPERLMSVDFAILEHVSLSDCEAHAERKVQHAVPARGPGARPIHWRHHHPDLSDVDLCPGRAWQAQGLRVRTHAEPDARGARAQHCGYRRRR